MVSLKNPTGLKAACLVIYAAAIVLGVLTGIWLPLIFVAALHLVEFFVVGKKTADSSGLPLAASFVNCMLFGFTWWMPLRDQAQRKES